MLVLVAGAVVGTLKSSNLSRRVEVHEGMSSRCVIVYYTE
jgi:hypothetical protein